MRRELRGPGRGSLNLAGPSTEAMVSCMTIRSSYSDPGGSALTTTAHSGHTVEVVLGRYQSKTVACRQCGKVWTSYEEKETDVNIAVSLVADAAAAGSDIALIVSADSDLCPAIRTARSLNPGRGMIAAFPPRRSSFEIRSLIRGAFTIAAVDLRNSLLPDTVSDPATDRVCKRPGKWR